MNTQANANLGAVQIYEDKSIFAAPLMSDDEWNAMSEEHQASQMAAESKIIALLETVLSTKEGRKAAAEAMRGDK